MLTQGYFRCTEDVCIILHGRGLASAIVAKEGCYLSVIEPQGQSIYCQLFSMAVDLYQVFDVNTWLDVSWLLLNTYSCGYNQDKDDSVLPMT